jgi:hypothetical protein
MLSVAVCALCFSAMVSAASDAECTFTLAMLAQGLEPPPGACFGPIHRVERRRAALQSGSCGVGRVSFVADADGDAAASCGDCTPGHSFIEDGVCSLGAFCRDNGTCADVSSSPYFGSECPFELGAHTSIGWCGSGLRCYAGRCVECLAGIDHIPETLRCSAAGRWLLLPDASGEAPATASLPADATPEEKSLLLAALLVSGLTFLVVSGLCCQQCCCSPSFVPPPKAATPPRGPTSNAHLQTPPPPPSFGDHGMPSHGPPRRPHHSPSSRYPFGSGPPPASPTRR